MASCMYAMDSYAQERSPACGIMYAMDPYDVFARAVPAPAAAGPADRLGKLAARQQAILDSLASLAAQIEGLGPAPTAPPAAAAAGGKHGQEMPDASQARALPAATDISLLCNPASPPYATLLAASVIAVSILFAVATSSQIAREQHAHCLYVWSSTTRTLSPHVVVL